MIIRIASSNQTWAAVELALLGEQLVGLIEALAALRLFAERGVDLLSAAWQPPRGMAQFAFADGIADADVHDALLMRMTRNSKGIQSR